jgi:hypothetical protein
MDESDSSTSRHATRDDDAIKVLRRVQNDETEDSDVSDGHYTDSLQGLSYEPKQTVFKNGGEDDETSSESDDELIREKQKSGNSHPGKVLFTRKKIVMISKANGELVPAKTSTDSNVNGSADVPKTRIKLSLKLPMAQKLKPKRNPPAVKKMKLPMSNNIENLALERQLSHSSEADEEVNELQATVVDSDEAEEVDVIATAVQDDFPDLISHEKNSKTSLDSGSSKKGHESSIKKTGILMSSSKSGHSSSKRKSFHSSRQIRLPPIPSPGLLIPAPTSTQSGQKNVSSIKLNGSGFCTPSELFDSFMELAGYTLEKRSNRPHRGSSVQKTVGDMFDSNVTLSLHFPELVPRCFLGNNQAKHSPDMDMNIDIYKQTPDALAPENKSKNEAKTECSGVTAHDLIRCMEKVTQNVVLKSKNGMNNSDTPLRTRNKRKRPSSFADMVPLSLTLPYPEDYIQNQVEYVWAVKSREDAIIKWQEEQLNIEISAEEGESSDNGAATSNSRGISFKNTILVPPIPLPPEPPKLEELEFDEAHNYRTGQHPIYLPYGKTTLARHLDSACFHITSGRYFGLSSNFVADPNFVGANAPGIAALSASAGTGLATSTIGSGSGSGGMVFTLSSSVQGGAGASHSSKSEMTTGEAKPIKSNGKIVSTKTVRVTNNKPALTPTSDSKSSSSKKVAPLVSPIKKLALKPTASSSNLRKIMEDGGPMTESFRKCIIRAAIFASRTGKQGPSFRGPDGETYPDVSKAFSAHAGIKPCQRCKSNKQGVRFWLYSLTISL